MNFTSLYINPLYLAFIALLINSHIFAKIQPNICTIAIRIKEKSSRMRHFTRLLKLKLKSLFIRRTSYVKYL